MEVNDLSGLTLIQKIIKNHADISEDDLFPGNIVWVSLDLVTARDYAGPQVISLFEQCYPKSTVFNNEKIVLTPDCYPYGNDPKHAQDQEILRVFSKKHNLTLTDLGSGIGSHLIVKRGFTFPGDIVIGADSHYNLLGAFGILGQGAGDVMLAFSFKTGKYWIKIPETVKVIITGTFHWPTTAKDVALLTLKKLHEIGITGNAVEFYGETVEKMSIEERITLCSLITEASGLIGFVPHDSKTDDFFRKYSDKKIERIKSDKDAVYSKTVSIDVQDLEPQIACPPHPHNVKPISEVVGTPLTSIIIGSCTNGTAKDIRESLEVLQNKKVNQNLRLAIIPATREDVVELAQDKTYLNLLESGANFFGTGCSTCAKGQYGLTGGKTTITLTTGNRNTQGKIGPGDVYLASPVIAAASAITGKITLPKKE